MVPCVIAPTGDQFGVHKVEVDRPAPLNIKFWDYCFSLLMLCVGVTTFPLNVSPLLVLLPHGGLGVGSRVPDNHCALKIIG